LLIKGMIRGFVLAAFMSICITQAQDHSSTKSPLPGHPGIFYSIKEIPCPKGSEPKPTPPKGYTGKKHSVTIPDALGTTARPNTVYTNPTAANKRQFSQGAPNRAQIGVMKPGTPAPQIDVKDASRVAAEAKSSKTP
jgi:hypothetical protein